MRSLSRFAVLFGLPALLLVTVTMAAWLALGAGQTGLGPMRLTPLPVATDAAPVADDSPAPSQLERISPLQAKLRNVLLPYSGSASGVATSYRGPAQLATTALECMTQAIYYEAAREPEIGKRAVAQVVVNRASSAPFPATICGVIQQGAPRPGCQFSFMCDGSLARRPDPALWAAAKRVAEAALRGETEPLVGGATHYHADYVFPTWAPTMTKLVKIGAHIFYRWRSVTSRPPPPFALDASPAAPPDPASAEPMPPVLPKEEAARGLKDELAGDPQSGSTVPGNAQATADANQATPPVVTSPTQAKEPQKPRDRPRRAIPERPLGSSPMSE